MSTPKPRVLVALSGGVDSSVALQLLHEQGYPLVGAHMKLWDFSEVGGEAKKDGRCCTLESIDDCRSICDKIGVPFYVFNFVERFREQVIENFVTEYRAGRTPNPCVVCNSRIKWESFLIRGRELGCEYIATGHYATIAKHESSGRFYVEKGADATRDQSYALWGLSQDALAHTLMPLGALQKTAVREIARRENVRTAEKPESREICFVADDNYRRFVREWEERHGREFQTGEIVDSSGQTLGEHQGVEFFTVGQRRKLGITTREPVYVRDIDPTTRRVVVGPERELYGTTMRVRGVNWQAIESPTRPLEVEVKVRYLSAPARGVITTVDDSTVDIRFDEPQRAITPGQSAVFYQGGVTLGGGVIEKATRASNALPNSPPHSSPNAEQS